jgi:hypothetical protein
VEGTVEQLFAEDHEDYPVTQMSASEADADDRAYHAWNDNDDFTKGPDQPNWGPGDGGIATVFNQQIADMVNSPTHYAQGGVEVIDVIRQALSASGFIDFCIGNVIKYANRARFKGNLVQDMAKAAWYARMAAGDDPRKGKV